MSAQVTQVVPYLLITGMERSLRYYVDGLGFSVKNKWVLEGKIRWCYLELGGAGLMLQQFHNEHGEKLGHGVSLWFQCDDAIGLYREFISRGIAADEPQVGNGQWDVRLADPDGYWLHFESPAADVPEETRLSEWIRTPAAR